MSAPLPAPPKHRAAAPNNPSTTTTTKPSGLAYDNRIRINGIILVSQLVLIQIGLWGLFIRGVKAVVGQALGSIIDWCLTLLPLYNVGEALWAKARAAPPATEPAKPVPAVTPTQKKLQALSTSVPPSLITNSMPRGLAYSSPPDSTPKRRDLRFPDVQATLAPDTSFNSAYSSPSPSVQARSRMKASIKSPNQQDLFASRSSSVESVDLSSSGTLPGTTASRRRTERGNSREPSPFSISTLSLKNVPKPGRALDASSLRGLVS
ncbi:hypothetical protein FRC17_005680 [Serendipita sp. 399]|nr:hypothetical protein FRC17_005680 [Serendipita sp. 399]